MRKTHLVSFLLIAGTVSLSHAQEISMPYSTEIAAVFSAGLTDSSMHEAGVGFTYYFVDFLNVNMNFMVAWKTNNPTFSYTLGPGFQVPIRVVGMTIMPNITTRVGWYSSSYLWFFAVGGGLNFCFGPGNNVRAGAGYLFKGDLDAKAPPVYAHQISLSLAYGF